MSDQRVKVPGRADPSAPRPAGPVLTQFAGLEQQRMLRRNGSTIPDQGRRPGHLPPQDRERALAVAEELAELGSWVWDLRSGDIDWSPQIYQILEVSADTRPDLVAYLDAVHPDDATRLSDVLDRAIRFGEPYETEHRIAGRHGGWRIVLARGRGEFSESGELMRLAGSFQDVTRARAEERELRQSRDLFRGVLDAAVEQSIIATDAQGLITVFNTGAERMLGYRADEMIGRSLAMLLDPVEIAIRAGELGVEPDFGVFLLRAAAGHSETRRWTYVTGDGRRLQAMITVSAMRGPDGEISGYIKVGTDITSRLEAQSALRVSELRLQDLFRHAPNGMMVIGLRRDLGRFLEVNPALCRLTGYDEERLLKMNVEDLTDPAERADHRRRFQEMAAGATTDLAVERHWIRADGQDLWVQFNVSPRRFAGDAYVIGQAQDITARKQAEDRLTHQVLHDDLTGLPNRLLLMDRIEHSLAAAARSNGRVAVLYLDLDGFKGVNDRSGHAAGDELLVQVAERLTDALRPGDTVARLGGDEFVIVCESLENAATAERIAERVCSTIRSPYLLDSGPVEISASLGVCVSDGAVTAASLLHAADQAMYVAKEGGKDRVRVSGRDDPELAARAARAARTVWVGAELAKAEERHELVVFGQPILDLRTGRVVAVESLLRWQHPERGLIGPNEFLDVAEGGGQILPIGRLALDESCRMAAVWSDLLGPTAPAVHVNVSGRQLDTGNLRLDVLGALERHEVGADRLVLELTETHMPMLADSLLKDVRRMRRDGLRVAIDDLGTGYSSLTRITELPVDILKIDVSFVSKLTRDSAAAAVARGILAIGAAMNLEVIAEGVEDEEQQARLVEFGCTLAQGYLYSRPLPEPELLEYLDQHRVPNLRVV